MAVRDYIMCRCCGCKVIYDGYQVIREQLEQKWGDPSASEWTALLICPTCDKARENSIAELEKVAEAATEWFGPSLQDARFETVAIIKALREAGYTYTTQEESK